MRTRRFSPALLLVFGFIAAPLSFAEKVAITFDDLPLNGELPPGVNEVDVAKRVLAILKTRNVPQVFGFINAKKTENNPAGADALKIWVASGARVGNHTYSHLDLHQNAPDVFIADIEANESFLKTLSPRNDWRWLRYPYLREGNTLDKRRDVRDYLAKHHYTIAHVTLDYEDYLWNTPYARCVAKHDAKSVEWLRDSYLRIASDYLDYGRQLAQLVYGRPIDHVLLLHLGAFSEEILPAVFTMLKEKHFTLATLEEVQSDAAYRIDPDAASQYGGTLLEQLMDSRKIPYPPITKKPTKELDALCR